MGEDDNDADVRFRRRRGEGYDRRAHGPGRLFVSNHHHFA
jgi:hypothetical protein